MTITNTKLVNWKQHYDAANQVTGYTGPEGTLAYDYDQLGQLIEVSGARSESYSYDENGNRTMSGYVTGTNNRLTSDGTYDYAYDHEGNMISRLRLSDNHLTEFTWDFRNRLTQVVEKDAGENIIKEANYTYDALNRRIRVSEDADGDGEGDPVVRSTVYDGPNPYADFDGEGSLTTRYLYGLGIDQLLGKMDAQNNVSWHLTDNLGSVRQVAASDGTVLDALDYDSFGQILNESSPEDGDRMKFTSREWDAFWGQYNYRAREYAPDIGRFTSQDPMSFAAGDTDLYRYVFNSPIGATDPTGMTPFVLAPLAPAAPAIGAGIIEVITIVGGAGGTIIVIITGMEDGPSALPTITPPPPVTVMGPHQPSGLPPIVITRPNPFPANNPFGIGAIPGLTPTQTTLLNRPGVIPFLSSPTTTCSGPHILATSFSRPGARPWDAPSGTIPINMHPGTKDIVHTIKDNLIEDGVGPASYVGISPDGDVIVTNPDGSAENLGPWEQYAD